MNSQFEFLRSTLSAVLIAVSLSAFSIGCGSGDKGTIGGGDGGTIDFSPNVDDDIATTLAAELASENGGASEQLVDIVSLASTNGLSEKHLITGEGDESSLEYIALTGTWEWNFERAYSSVNGLYTARVKRTYQWRFLKKNGHPQVTYIHDLDTAYTIELAIIDGSGRHEAPFLTQRLTSLSGHLVATGANTNDIVVTGAWSRSAIDTIRTRYAERALAHTCSLAIADMHCQRDTSSQPWLGLSGAINGTFSVTIDFSSGDAYPEDSLTRTFSVVLDTGAAAITLGDSTWVSDLRRGEFH